MSTIVQDRLAVFSYIGLDIRVVIIDDTPWWVAADVTAALGIVNGRNATARLDQAGVRQTDIRSGGQVRAVTVIDEGSMYELIFRSDKPDARDFRRWVTSVVLPEIRETGSFVAAVPAVAVPQTLSEALRAYADEVDARVALEAKVEADAPKVAYVDEFLTREDSVVFRVAAGEIGIRESELRDRLIEARWIYRLRIGSRWSVSKGKREEVFEYRAHAAHAEKFRLMPQHNAPRHHNDQVQQTLYIRSEALPAIRRRVLTELKAVTS